MVGKATFVDETIKGERKDEAVVIKRAIRITLVSLFVSLVDAFRSYLFSVSLGQARADKTFTAGHSWIDSASWAKSE